MFTIVNNLKKGFTEPSGSVRQQVPQRQRETEVFRVNPVGH
ncbi:MAG TPA: hypothetical protein VI750_08580 [Pyrinomonadaceae bacterium]|nr:hypothetical protein [Pyrinomonadaceae bacterium]